MFGAVRQLFGTIFPFLSGKDLIGIDLGHNSVKVAVMRQESHKYRLTHFSKYSLSEGAILEDEIVKPEEVVNAIKSAIKKAGITLKQACLGIGGPNTMGKRLHLGADTEEEIEGQVLWEAEQYISFGVDEAKITFDILKIVDGEGADVVIAAAREDLIENYKELFQEAGIKLSVVDLNLFALANIFELLMQERKEDLKSGCLVICFGAQMTSFLVFKDASILFTREITLGGDMITEEIQRQMGVNFLEAEDLKINGDENGQRPIEIAEIMDVVLGAFVKELKKTYDFYQNSSSEEEIQKCFITGGSSLIPGINEKIQQELDIDVELIDPFSVIKCDNKIRKSNQREFSAIGLLAMGLALRKVDD